MKVCNKCNEKKSLTEFNKHPAGKQGVSPQCKSCEKIIKKKWYLIKRLNPDWVKEKRERARKSYHSNKKKHNVSKTRSNSVEYKLKYPEKYKAVYLAKTVPIPKGFQRHHWSYNDEYVKDIIALSILDHNQLHRFLEYCQESMIYKCTVNVGSFKRGDLLDTRKKHCDYFIELKLSDLWE